MNDKSRHTNFNVLEHQKLVFENLCRKPGFLSCLKGVALYYTNNDYYAAEEIVSEAIEIVVIRLWVLEKTFDHPTLALETQMEIFLKRIIKFMSFKCNKKRKDEIEFKRLFLLLMDDNENEYFPRQDYYSGLDKALTKVQFKSLLFLAEGKSYQEISLIIKKPINAVGNAIHKARNTAKSYFKSVREFQKSGKELSKEDFIKISAKLDISERTLKRFYNCWKISK